VDRCAPVIPPKQDANQLAFYSLNPIQSAVCLRAHHAAPLQTGAEMASDTIVVAVDSGQSSPLALVAEVSGQILGVGWEIVPRTVRFTCGNACLTIIEAVRLSVTVGWLMRWFLIAAAINRWTSRRDRRRMSSVGSILYANAWHGLPAKYWPFPSRMYFTRVYYACFATTTICHASVKLSPLPILTDG
jgi:hypothetical protein